MRVVDFAKVNEAGRACPVLVDGNNLVVRAIMASALDDLKAGGQFTGGLYGALTSMSALLVSLERDNIPASEIVMFFDAGVPLERLRLIPTYKQARKEQRELLTAEEKERAYAQIAASQTMFGLLGVKVLRYRNREADDCCAAATQLCAKRDRRPPTVVSGDRDLFQCVQLGGRVWYLNTKEWVTRENFAEKVGGIFDVKEKVIGPELYVLFRALTGDKSDGILGVRGLGPVRAEKLLLDVSVWLDAESNGQFSLADYDPITQLANVCAFLESAPEGVLSAHLQGVLTERGRLVQVIGGISLQESFGPAAGMLAKINEPSAVKKMDMLRLCKQYNFMSVLGDPARFVAPFERAVERATLARKLRATRET